MVYQIPNESIEAVYTGLGSPKGKRVLSIGSSGCIPLFLAAKGNIVEAVELNPAQSQFAIGKINALRESRFSDFFTRSVPYNAQTDLEHWAEFFTDGFSASSCESEQSNLKGKVSLCRLTPVGIHRVSNRRVLVDEIMDALHCSRISYTTCDVVDRIHHSADSEFDCIYLSNVVGYALQDNKDGFNRIFFENAARSLSPNGVLYLTHNGLIDTFENLITPFFSKKSSLAHAAQEMEENKKKGCSRKWQVRVYSNLPTHKRNFER